MLRFTLLVTAFFVSGCDFNLDKAVDLYSGREVNLVILESNPVQLTPKVTMFTSQTPMKIVGELTFVCLALRGGIPMQDSKVMNQVFETTMNNSKVKVVIVLASGDRVTLHQPLSAWNMHGTIIKNDEMSACASTPCKTELPAGSLVTKVEISSEPALQVQGVYWTSEMSPLEKPPSPATTPASAVKVKSSCAA
ncbi:MAG: hypothetical protein WC236_03925 [Gallionellaceae bacterium]|jgi:hypothetical protein